MSTCSEFILTSSTMVTYIALTPLYRYFIVSCSLCLDLAVFVSHMNHKQLGMEGKLRSSLYTPSTRHGDLYTVIEKAFARTVPLAQETFPYSPPTHSPLNLVYYYLLRGEHLSPHFSCIHSGGTPIVTFVAFCPVLTHSFILGLGVPFDWGVFEKGFRTLSSALSLSPIF